MKLGRNDPCHCGSGKKYKKCCLEKDEAASRTMPPEDFVGEDEEYYDEEETDGVLESEPDAENDTADWDVEEDDDDDYDDDDEYEEEEDDDAPEVDVKAANQRWREFEKQDYEGKIALFLKTLEAPQLMDDQMAFDMLDTLRAETSKRHERDRYDAAVEQLRERLPKIYAKGAHFYLENCITNAVIAGRFERIPRLLNELAQRAGRDIDSFNNTVVQLAYHGQLPMLIDAMRLAWPEVRESPEVVPWGIDEVADQSVQFLVFDYVEKYGAEAAGYADLFERAKFYSTVEPERLTKFIALLAGKSERRWTQADFAFTPKARPSRGRYDDEPRGIQIPKNIRQNLFDLSLEFQGEVRHELKMPLIKSELGRRQIVQYLMKRLAGELEPRLSMVEAAFNKPKPKTRPPEFYLRGDESSVNWLCPDRETLEHFLNDLFHFLNPQPYTAAATLELMPAWLRFLESRQLLVASLREKTLQNLLKLSADLNNLLRKMSPDPALHRALENWGKEGTMS